MIRIIYVWHDCFVVFAPECTLVFDYWCDGRGLQAIHDGGEPEFLKLIPRDKPLYFIVSHHHKDHFTRDIFGWKDVCPQVRYILSRDTEKSIRYMLRPGSIYRGVRPDPEQVTVLRPGDVYEDNVLKISAFGSTDIGNSYMVQTAGKRLFHAGDLNAWIWKDESTAAEVAAAVRDFEKILSDIAAAEGTRIDLAFFPVDSRIGRDYWEGAKIFVRRMDVGIFVPMHFGLGETPEEVESSLRDAVDFAAYANPERGVYVPMPMPYVPIAF